MTASRQDLTDTSDDKSPSPVSVIDLTMLGKDEFCAWKSDCSKSGETLLSADLVRPNRDETSVDMALDSPANEDLAFLIPSRRFKHIGGVSSVDG